MEEYVLKKINYIIENEQRNNVIDVGKCLYLHGGFAKKHDNESKANKNFEEASKRGNERVRQEIARKKRNERISFPSFINVKSAPCCYTNTFTGNNYMVVSTFPSEKWVMYTPDNNYTQDMHSLFVIDFPFLGGTYCFSVYHYFLNVFSVFYYLFNPFYKYFLKLFGFYTTD